MALNQCPMKVQKIKKPETMLSKSQSKVMSRKNVFRKTFGVEGETAQPCALSSQKWPRTLEWNKPENIFYIFYYFKLKKDPRRKIINVSQLAFRNSNYVSRKHLNIPRFFIFVWFSMKAKTFPAHICRKKNFLFVKNMSFSCATH